MEYRSSNKSPVRKRPRMNESSNMATTKTLPSSALLASGEVSRGLDPSGNPDISFCTTNTQRALAQLSPVRNLEWFRPPTAVVTSSSRHSRKKFTSLLGQRSGMRVPTGKECTACIQRPGPLKGCVIHNGISATSTGPPIGRGACMNCLLRNAGRSCSLRRPESCKDLWFTQYLFPKFLDQRRATQDKKRIEVLPGYQATLSWDQKVHPSLSSNQRTNKGPSYPEKWYQTPLDNAALAKKPDEMRVVLKELRQVRARIEWDIRKLSRFVGSDDVEGKGLGNPNVFHEAGSVDDSITPADGNSVEIGTLAIDSPGWNSSGHDFDGDDVDGDDVDGDDIDGDDIDDEVYEEDSVEIDSDAVSGI